MAALAMIGDRGVTPGTICLLALAALFLDYPIFSGAGVAAGSALDGLIWGTTGSPAHWGGAQFLSGNLYVLAGLAILGVVALVIAETSASTSARGIRPWRRRR